MQPEVEDPAIANFELHDNALTANVELYWENHAEFLRYCQTLLQQPDDHLILDLTHVSFVFSAYMGSIGRLLTQASQQGKRLTIRVNRNLTWLFDIVGFDKLATVELVP